MCEVIGSSNEEEDKEEECMGRYLSTSLKSTVEALHSISSKDLVIGISPTTTTILPLANLLDVY